jgi:uncharacterized membrane protein
MLTFCRLLTAFLTCLLLATLLSVVPVVAQDTEDSQLFLSGFNAYQQKDYPAAITRLGDVLQNYPDTSLRDMTLFWLARSHYKAGHRQDAARYMAQFTREYPDNPLKNTVEEDLLALAAQYEKNQGSADQIAAAKLADEKLKAAQAEAERAAQQKLARQEAEKMRILKAKLEAERIAREQAEAERLAVVKAEADRLAQQKADQEAAEKARILKAKAEADRIIREKAEADRLAALKLEQQKKQVAEEAERVAREKLEAQRLAAAKTEAERLVQLKIAQEAAEKARILKAKAEADRIAREKAEADQLAARKLEQEKQQAADEERRIAREQRIAAAKAEADRIALENDRKAREKAEAERLAVVRAEQARLAQERAAAEKIAAQKAIEERRQAEKAAVAAADLKERELAAATKAEADRATAEKLRQERAVLKEKAISEYKRILDRFPGSPAARTAATRLKELGVAVALPVTASAPAVSEVSTGTTQILTLEVAQYAAFEFDLQPQASPVQVARKTSIPFEIQNRGNGQDSFYLASSFPAEFGVRFAAVAAPEQAINQTPLLVAGERFKGVLQLTVPPSAIDGLRIAHPVKAASQFMGEASQSRVISLIAAAPLLRAVVKTEKLQLLPGEKLQYRVAVLNVGSTTAEDVTLRLNYPAQYQPVDVTPAGFRQEMNAALVLDGIALKSGESRDLLVTFQLKDEALAKEELMVRADLLNNTLQTRGTFLSNATFVLPVSDLALRIAHERVIAVPGQTVTVPARVVNKGNQRERISLVATAAQFQKVVIYHDLNRDGLRQPGEPEVTAIGPLGPKEEAALLLEVVTPRNAQDGTVEKVTLTAAPESAPNRMVTADAQIGYSRPMLQLAMKGREGRMVPGELLTVELDVLNRGSNLAKLVDLEISWPEQVELVAADQPADKTHQGVSSWRFNELGAGEKRTIKASFRIKSGTGVGTGVQLKSVLTYQDPAGNRY